LDDTEIPLNGFRDRRRDAKLALQELVDVQDARGAARHQNQSTFSVGYRELK
jgi:ribosome-associated protein YbcJ (S4-like RNA binding protein)